MLQLGIMIHSLVIGLTLAIASGPEFSAYHYFITSYASLGLLTIVVTAFLVQRRC